MGLTAHVPRVHPYTRTPSYTTRLLVPPRWLNAARRSASLQLRWDVRPSLPSREHTWGMGTCPGRRIWACSCPLSDRCGRCRWPPSTPATCSLSPRTGTARFPPPPSPALARRRGHPSLHQRGRSVAARVSGFRSKRNGGHITLAHVHVHIHPQHGCGVYRRRQGSHCSQGTQGHTLTRNGTSPPASSSLSSHRPQSRCAR